MNDPVVITGLGVLSPLGIGAQETVAAWREGVPALAPATRFDAPAGSSPLCGEVPEFRVEEYVPSAKAYLDRNSALLLAACGLARRDAALPLPDPAPERIGILAGTAWSGQDSMAAFFADYAQKGPRLVKPFLFPHTYANTAVSLAALEWSLRGAHQGFSAGRVSAGHAIVEACDLLREDEADALLAGGAEALGPALFGHLAALGLLKPAEGAGTADGIDPAEAGAMLVLERRGRARERGATERAVVLGAGLGSAPVAAIRQALAEAGVAAGDLAAVIASANGQPAVDRAEAEALRETIGLPLPPVIAPARLCGDTLGACAALQTALAALALSDPGAVPAVLLRPGPILILATDPSGSSVALVLAGGEGEG
jgi:3-oxoacyl-[acyl-carrier-protein] synthase II